MYTNRGEKTKIHPPPKKKYPYKETQNKTKQKTKGTKKAHTFIFVSRFLGVFSACISYIDCQNKLQKDF